MVQLFNALSQALAGLRSLWGARPSRALVLASRQDNLKSSRSPETIADAQAGRAPQNPLAWPGTNIWPYRLLIS